MLQYKQDKRIVKLGGARRIMPMPKPGADASDREKATYWRVNVMRLTQDRLAKLLNIRRGTVWAYENGEQPMTRMYRLACLGLQVMRPWDEQEWPWFGNEKEEDLTFHRMKQAELNPEDID